MGNGKMFCDGANLICREQRSLCQAVIGAMPRLHGYLLLWLEAWPCLLPLWASLCSRDGSPGPLTSKRSKHYIPTSRQHLLTWFAMALVMQLKFLGPCCSITFSHAIPTQLDSALTDALALRHGANICRFLLHSTARSKQLGVSISSGQT